MAVNAISFELQDVGSLTPGKSNLRFATLIPATHAQSFNTNSKSIIYKSLGFVVVQFIARLGRL